LNPARANSFARPYLKKTNLKKRAGGVAQAEGHEFKPQCHKKKKKEEEEAENLNTTFKEYVVEKQQ
jgi:hypothetical protein